MNVPKRVIKDIKNFQTSNLNESGIYCHFDEDDFTQETFFGDGIGGWNGLRRSCWGGALWGQGGMGTQGIFNGGDQCDKWVSTI